MSFEKGQKLLYLTIKDERPHAEVVTFNGGTQFDQCDVISSNIYTKEQILEMFDGKSCVCPSSPPGVLLDDGTCGNCSGVVKPKPDFYDESMEKHFGLRICPECGHENRHPQIRCDECTKYLEPISKWMKCPRCRIPIIKGRNFCNHCNANIPPCYGVVTPRSQDCGNCVHTVECLEEQNKPVISPDVTPDDRMFPPGTLHHEIELPSDNLIKIAKISDELVLCPNCKQPVSDKYEHSEGDYDGIDVSQWWECPDVGSGEEIS